MVFLPANFRHLATTPNKIPVLLRTHRKVICQKSAAKSHKIQWKKTSEIAIFKTTGSNLKEVTAILAEFLTFSTKFG
jgi:hypothetical protein